MYLLLARSDFDPKQGSVTFTRRSRECYRQRITNDNVPERTESFKVSMEFNKHISIGNPSSAKIEINDDDEGVYVCVYLPINSSHICLCVVVWPQLHIVVSDYMLPISYFMKLSEIQLWYSETWVFKWFGQILTSGLPIFQCFGSLICSQPYLCASKIWVRLKCH